MSTKGLLALKTSCYYMYDCAIRNTVSECRETLPDQYIWRWELALQLSVHTHLTLELRNSQYCKHKYALINPRRACAARVTCVCVCLLSNISPMERLFVLKTLSRTQRATKVKRFVGFSLKPLRCRDPALPPLYVQSAIFPRVILAYAHAYFSCIYAHDTPPRVQHFSAFHYHCNLNAVSIAMIITMLFLCIHNNMTVYNSNC